MSTPRVGLCLGGTGLSGVTDDTPVFLGLGVLGGPGQLTMNLWTALI